MGTNCAPLVADLFLFCYERDFMMSLSDDKQADVIDAFNTTSRYLDDILNINNVYFDNMVSQIYPSELQLNKANASDTEAAFLDLHLSIPNDIVSTKIYDKRDDFDFEIVNFPFLDGDVPRSTSYGVYISQLIRPGRVAQSVTCLATDACLTANPGVASSIPARYHTFVEIDHEIISTVILLPSADLFKKGCCQLQAKVCPQITG